MSNDIVADFPSYTDLECRPANLESSVVIRDWDAEILDWVDSMCAPVILSDSSEEHSNVSRYDLPSYTDLEYNAVILSVQCSGEIVRIINIIQVIVGGFIHDPNRLITIIKIFLIRSKIETNPGPITSELYENHIELLTSAKDKMDTEIQFIKAIHRIQFLRDAMETIISVYKCLGHEKLFHELKNNKTYNQYKQQQEYFLDHQWFIEKELNLNHFTRGSKQRADAGKLIDQLIVLKNKFPRQFRNTSESRDMLSGDVTDGQEIARSIRPIVERSYHLTKCILQERIRNQNNQGQETFIELKNIPCPCKTCERNHIKENLTEFLKQTELLEQFEYDKCRESFSNLNHSVEEALKVMSSITENHSISSSVAKPVQRMHYDGGGTYSVAENHSISSPIAKPVQRMHYDGGRSPLIAENHGMSSVQVQHIHYDGGRTPSIAENHSISSSMQVQHMYYDDGVGRERGGFRAAQVTAPNRHGNGKDTYASHKRGMNYYRPYP